MRSSAFGMVYEPKEISEDMLPEVGTIWTDTYNAMPREAVILEIQKRDSNPVVWQIRCQENQLFRREFTMYAHGFLSRYRSNQKVE